MINFKDKNSITWSDIVRFRERIGDEEANRLLNQFASEDRGQLTFVEWLIVNYKDQILQK